MRERGSVVEWSGVEWVEGVLAVVLWNSKVHFLPLHLTCNFSSLAVKNNNGNMHIMLRCSVS